MPTIVTGHGRSGTHWLAHVLGQFVDARHEPAQIDGDVVVDCRLWGKRDVLEDEHRMVHLVRDGRDVVRSAYEFYQGSYDFERTCETWAMVVEHMRGLPFVRLEDLTARQAAAGGHRMSHWADWPEDMRATFWRRCGDAMRHYGYAP